MDALRSEKLPLVLAGVFLLVALSGQYVSDSSLDSGSSAATVQAVGRASNSYLTGIRTYAAAVLWNRIDPLMHGYYEDAKLEDQRYMLSSIALIEWLDPAFAPAYYVGPWILVRNDKVDEGMAMAKRGVEQIPESGMCRTSYAQLLLTQRDDIAAAVEQGKAALDETVVWTDGTEQMNAYAAIAQIFRQAGETQLVAYVAAEIDRIDATVDNGASEDIHDHDGDGKPDH